MIRSTAIYRAFLLPEALEVDLGFTSASAFGALGPGFKVIFGRVQELRPPPPPAADHLIGLAWHHVLHARVCIERGQLWQAEYWITALRDLVITLICLREGLPTIYARSAHLIPESMSERLALTLVRNLDPQELWRSFREVTNAIREEIQRTDSVIAERLDTTLVQLQSVSTP